MTTYIIGHKKPDLDATVSAMAVAEFRKQRGDNNNPTPVLADPINPETTAVFSKFNLEAPKVITSADIKPEDKVILVDHNEVEQRLDGLNQDQIIAVIDHHKVNLNLNLPIKITTLPVGSTCTIVYLKFKQYNLSIPEPLAKLMLGGILSDTVGLKSGTTTEKDRQAVNDLGSISKIEDIDSFTLEIFKAKSNISSLTPEQIVKNDYKVFDFAKKTFIGQVETVEQDLVLNNRKAELLASMQQVKQSEGVELLFLVITDILKVNSKLLLLSDSEQQIAIKAFGGTPTANILDIGPKLSRKKDIAPPIEKALNG